MNENIDKNLLRMKQLMGESLDKTNKTFTVELSKIGPDNKSYGIIREGQKYFIKVSNKTSNIIAEDFKYINGLKNKTDFMYPTYAKAIKQLNLKFISLCEAYDVEYKVDTFINDNIIEENIIEETVITEDDNSVDFGFKKGGLKISDAINDEVNKSIKKKTLTETTFKLKVPGTGNQQPSPEPKIQLNNQPQQQTDNTSGLGNDQSNDKPFDDEPFDAGVDADESTDPKKFIQQLSGKLGQSLRKYTDESGQPDFDLEKFAINSVISATHTAEMDEEDKKDIISKINTSGNEQEPTNDPQSDNTGQDNNQENFGESLNMSENISSFVNINKIKNMLRETFDCGCNIDNTIDEVLNNTVEPVVKPTVKPGVTPSRRSKPFRVPVISPENSPKPKAVN